MFRALRSALLVLSTLALSVTACAPDSELADSESAEDLESELSLSFSPIDVSKQDAPAGLTILTKTSDYVAFFGTKPPSSVNFQKHWVLHYSLGMQPTGGYGASFDSVDRVGTGANKRLVIGTHSVSPGPACFVTQAFTNPQATVIISKQKKSIGIDQSDAHTLTDCSEPDFCASALCGPGQICDESIDACTSEAFCPKVKCANGYVCDEDVDSCVGRPCEPGVADTCPAGFSCDNQIQCITVPCPEDFRCEPAPQDPCQGIDWVGTCDGAVLKYCDAGVLVTIDCAPAVCGYSNTYGYFDCQ